MAGSAIGESGARALARSDRGADGGGGANEAFFVEGGGGGTARGATAAGCFALGVGATERGRGGTETGRNE
ncbi:MAG TPA: hypothetical protein VM686_37660 [Polyangiaceae bacterium]|nr:hypothetical protein [Polyangiaceae bacterium]